MYLYPCLQDKTAHLISCFLTLDGVWDSAGDQIVVRINKKESGREPAGAGRCQGGEQGAGAGPGAQPFHRGGFGALSPQPFSLCRRRCSPWEFPPEAFTPLLVSEKLCFFSTGMILDTSVLAWDPRAAPTQG